MSKNKNIFFIFILFLFIPLVRAEDIPILNLYVTDNTHSLTSTQITSIESLCRTIDERTGSEIAVLLTNLENSTDINEYATQVFTKNGIGKKDQDNGILIIVNPLNNDWIIQVGYGLEGTFNDAKLARIGRTYLEPQIDLGEYSQGIYNTIQVISAELDNTVTKKNWIDENWKFIIAALVLILILILTKGQAVIWIGGILSGGRFGGGRTGGGMGKR